MAFRLLTDEEVRRLLPMEECIALMGDALAALARGEVHQPLRTVVRPPATESMLGLMPAYRQAPFPAYGLKTVCIVPGNPARGLDAHQGTVALLDGETGELRALMNASPVTEIRTAAVSAVATRLLAREDASRLALLGAGVQGHAHLEALSAVRSLEGVRVWSRTPERARTFASRAEGRYPFPVEPVTSPETAVLGADVVVTATFAREPILRRTWLARGAHVNAVGSATPTARELDTATIAEGALFVDRRESALNEAGDYVLAAREGAVGPEHIRAELGEVLVGLRPGRSSPDELTVFKSLGLAVEDLFAAEHVLRRAEETGVGTVMPF